MKVESSSHRRGDSPSRKWICQIRGIEDEKGKTINEMIRKRQERVDVLGTGGTGILARHLKR